MLEEEDHKKEIILASASPRRKKILELFGMDFKVIRPENFEEKQYKNPYRTVAWNSIGKAKNVYNYIKKQNPEKEKPDCIRGFLIAGFDTIVYVDRENVLDKAGAYNVLGYGSLLVEKISGCFYNIAGIPIAKFVDLLREFGFNVIG